MRIVSMLASGTEIVNCLGLGKRLVGISHECDFPGSLMHLPRTTRTLLDESLPSGAIDQAVRARMTAGLPLYEIDRELLSRLEPDLILTQGHCEVCAISDRDVEACVAASESLRSAEIVSLQPSTLESVFNDIRKVAEATNCSDEAVEGLRQRVRRIQLATASVEKKPRTVCIEWIHPIMVAANWMPDLIEFAGGLNQLTRSGDRSAVTPWEDVVEFDPEVIVIMPCGFDLPRTRKEWSTLRSLPGWSQLSAVQNRDVIAIDGNSYFNRSGPRLVDSLEILAHLLHPDVVSDPTSGSIFERVLPG